MKFTIEVEDFWMSEDSDSLSVELNRYVTHEVANQIWNKIKEKVDKEIGIAVQEIIEKELTLKINTRIADIMKSETITRSGKEVLISDHIKSLFTNHNGWNNPTEVIEKFAKTFGSEMKKRYDFVFASQIVKEMQTVGLLKDDVVVKLLEGVKS